MQRVELADNLDVLRGLPDSSVDLIYTDPPFGTGRRQRLDSIRTGRGDRIRGGFAGRTYPFEVVSTIEYRDDLPFEQYLGFLELRLVEMHRVLAPDGSLYLHLGFSTRSSGPTTTEAATVIAGPANTIRSSGMPREIGGSSIGKTLTGSHIWRPAWSARRRQPGESYRPTFGG